MRNRAFLHMLVALLAATMLLSGCSKRDDDVLRVGMEASYAPFNWTQMDAKNGAVPIDGTTEYAGGYDVEIAKRIATALGKRLVIVKTEWTGLVPAVVSGKIDLIIAGMSPTAERSKSIDFSNNYYESQLVMVVRRGGAYENAKTIADFAGAKITAQLNTFHYEVIPQIKGVNKQPAMDEFAAMRVALQAGIIDGYVSERPEGISAETANPALKMVEFTDGFTASPEDVAIAVGLAKGSALRTQINQVLAGISQQTRAELMDTAIRNQPMSR